MNAFCYDVLYFHTRLHPYKISHATRNHNFYSISPWFLQSLKGCFYNAGPVPDSSYSSDLQYCAKVLYSLFFNTLIG